MENEFYSPVKQGNGALVEVESQRAIQEVQAAVISAKRFPRDENAAYLRIMKACERVSLAESATYAFPRGKEMITGPSIRLAETIAQSWGNLQFGIRELSQKDGWSEVEAYAWDLETNTRNSKIFSVQHIRKTKHERKALDDPRDIYELVANNGSRRLRACILGIIPGDIVEAAWNKCDDTLKKGGGKPLEDRVRDMLAAFDKVGVTKEMIEARLTHKITAVVESQLVDLRKIYNSLKDGMSQREHWFTIEAATSTEAANDLTEKVKAAKRRPESQPESVAQAEAEIIPGPNVPEEVKQAEPTDNAHQETGQPISDPLNGLMSQIDAALAAKKVKMAGVPQFKKWYLEQCLAKEWTVDLAQALLGEIDEQIMNFRVYLGLKK